MQCQFVLNSSKLFHKCFHLIFTGRSQKVTDFIHSLFFLKQRVKSRLQDFLYGHSLFQNCMLIKITGMDIFCPFHFTFIGHQLPGHNTHKSRFSFTVSAYKADVFSLEKSKGNIRKDSSVSKSMREMFNV